MSIFYHGDEPFLLIKFIDEDIVPDMNAPPSLHRPVKWLSDLRVLTDLLELLHYLLKAGSIFCLHLPEGCLNIRISDYCIRHSEMALIKASIDSYVFPFPFLIPASAFFTCRMNSGLMADSGG